MDRHFIMHSERENGWFCGKCGKRLLPDLYNAQKHAEACGFGLKEEGASRNLVEDDTIGYRLRAEEGALHLEICLPVLVRIRGFADRFHGLSWIRVLEAVFPADARTPVIAENRTGVDLDTWLALIRAGRCVRIHAGTNLEVVRDVFPGIIGLYSLQMFVYIYRTKGFHHVRLFSDSMAERMMAADTGTAARDLPEEETDRFDREPSTLLNASLLHCRDSVLVLRLTIPGGPARASFLFSRGFAACSRTTALAAVLSGRYRFNRESDAAIRRFARHYPEYGLEQYMERSSNVFVPLIGPDYHCLAELAGKAGVPAVAENMESLPQFKLDPAVCRNLREAFGLPVRVLRALDREDANEALLQSLAEIYSMDPGLLQFDRITPSMCAFFQNLEVRASGRSQGSPAGSETCARQYRIHGFGRENFTEDRIRRILRYLSRRPGHETWGYLRDYQIACRQLGEYPYGLFPKMPLREAHDRVVARIRFKKRGQINDERFCSSVRTEQYISLTTNESEEDKEIFRDDPYLILAPEKREDLFIESENMHNCVRIYENLVMDRKVKIFFLRKKEAPGKSFGTIEVRGSLLVQAKGFANSRLGKEEQAFVRKWCGIKHLTICTRDIMPGA